MRHPAIGRKKRYQMTVAGFSGGLNLGDLPSEAAEEQLTDALNFWWQGGVLRTRPAVRFAAEGQAANDRLYGEEGRAYRRLNGYLYCGQIAADGTQQWQREPLAIADLNVLPVMYDAARLEGWTAGESDGSLLFLGNGDVVAPLKKGGFQNVNNLICVPQLLTGGKGVEGLTEPKPAQVRTQSPNLLTPAFRAGYTTDGVGKIFYLPEGEIDTSKPITAMYTDASGRTFTHTLPALTTHEATAGADGLRLVFLKNRSCVWFENGSGETTALPLTGVSDNLTVTASFVRARDAAVVGDMKIVCWFGGKSSGLSGGTRLFVAGDPRHPQRVYWSDAENPLYFPADNYAAVGDMADEVTAFGKQGELLVIFKKRELYAAKYEIPSADMPDGACISLFPLHGGAGCGCPQTLQLCGDRLVWLHSDGRVYTLVSGSPYSGSSVRVASAPLGTSLRTNEKTMRSASAVCIDGWYRLLLSGFVWVFHFEDEGFLRLSSQTGDNALRHGTVWYRWTVPYLASPERLLSVDGQMLLITNNGSSYTFGGERDLVMRNGEVQEQPISCHLTTALFDFDRFDRCKTVREVLWDMAATDRTTVTATYITEQGQKKDSRKLSAHTYPSDIRWKTYRLTPHTARLQRFGLTLSSTAAIMLGAMVVRYDVDGSNRRGGDVF